jgi:hypothetical protein
MADKKSSKKLPNAPIPELPKRLPGDGGATDALLPPLGWKPTARDLSRPVPDIPGRAPADPELKPRLVDPVALAAMVGGKNAASAIAASAIIEEDPDLEITPSSAFAKKLTAATTPAAAVVPAAAATPASAATPAVAVEPPLEPGAPGLSGVWDRSPATFSYQLGQVAPLQTFKKSKKERTSGGTFKGLTEDPRFVKLPWKKKSIALQRFIEDNPSRFGGALKELERLDHFSNDGTPYSLEFHKSLYAARLDWLRSLHSDPDDPASADYRYQLSSTVAGEKYQKALEQRSADIARALEFHTAFDITKLAWGNVMHDVISAINPFDGLGVKDEEFGPAQELQKDIKKEFMERGYSEKHFNTLLNDASLASGAKKGPKAVADSHGAVILNDGAVVLDIEAVREAIKNLAAPELEKDRATASLESRRKKSYDGVFVAVALDGGLTWDGDGSWDPETKKYNKTNPKIRPTNTIGPVVSQFFSMIAQKMGVEGTSWEKSLEGSFEAEHDLYAWTEEQKLAAVQDLLHSRDGLLDRARIGVGKGAMVDIFNMVSTPLEMAGVDTARRLNEISKRSEDTSRLADELVNISTTAEMVELAARILPQVLITRKVGSLAGAGAASRGASAAMQARVATLFATGFGGYQSATFNARDVLDNGGTTGEALTAGMLGFGTTFLLANGFNAAGVGGVESFRRKAAAAGGVAKSQLRQRLWNITKHGLGEGVEEFIDEFINGLHTQDFTGATDNQLATNAFKAALIGGGFGAGFGAIRPTLKTISPTSSNSDVARAAASAMEGLGTDTDTDTETETETQEDARMRQEATDAARIFKLREKAAVGETFVQEDGTTIDTGLTEEEAIELEALENKLSGLPYSLDPKGNVVPDPIVVETPASGLKVGDTVLTPDGDSKIKSGPNVSSSSVTVDEVTTKESTTTFQMENGTEIRLKDGDKAPVVLPIPAPWAQGGKAKPKAETPAATEKPADATEAQQNRRKKANVTGAKGEVIKKPDGKGYTSRRGVINKLDSLGLKVGDFDISQDKDGTWSATRKEAAASVPRKQGQAAASTATEKPTTLEISFAESAKLGVKAFFQTEARAVAALESIGEKPADYNFEANLVPSLVSVEKKPKAEESAAKPKAEESAAKPKAEESAAKPKAE